MVGVVTAEKVWAHIGSPSNTCKGGQGGGVGGGAVGAVGAVRAEGVWAHIGSLYTSKTLARAARKYF